MEIKQVDKMQYIQQVEEKTMKLWKDFAALNANIETSMKGINQNTNELMEIFKDTTEQWVNEIIASMKKMTLIMNQCEIITKEFKQIEQIAKQTYYFSLFPSSNLLNQQ